MLVIEPLAPKYSVPLGSWRRSCWSAGKSSCRSAWPIAKVGRLTGTHSGSPQYETAAIVPVARAAKIAAAQVHSLSGLRRRRNGGAASNCEASSGSGGVYGGSSNGGGATSSASGGAGSGLGMGAVWTKRGRSWGDSGGGAGTGRGGSGGGGGEVRSGWGATTGA